MPSFSERFGFAARKMMQIDSMNEDLRRELWQEIFNTVNILVRDFNENCSLTPQLKDLWTKCLKKKH